MATTTDDTLRRDAGLGFETQDLTVLAKSALETEQSPFGVDSSYAQFFDAVCRALHRTEPRHILLLREPGVAERVVLVELARRGLEGTPRFLKDRQFLLVDCRELLPEQMRT